MLLFMSHTLSFASILHATSYSLFPVACWDNARRDVAFMSLGVIAESVTSSLASNFSADGITPRQIMHFSYAHYRDHRSIEKNIICLRLPYLTICCLIKVTLLFIIFVLLWDFSIRWHISYVISFGRSKEKGQISQCYKEYKIFKLTFYSLSTSQDQIISFIFRSCYSRVFCETVLDDIGNPYGLEKFKL